MIRFFTLLLALLSVPLTAQTIIVPVPFADSNGDGRVDFGSANRKAYGVPYVLLQRQTDAGWVYCGPAGCPAAKLADPATPLPPANIGCIPVAFGSTRELKAGHNAALSGACLSGGTFYKATATAGAVTLRDVVARSSIILDTKSYAGRIKTVTVQRLDAEITGGRGGFRVRGGPLASALFEDVNLRVSGVSKDSAIPCGICLVGKDPADTGGNVVFRRVSIDGVRSQGQDYPNGDGIATEARYSNVRYEGVRVTNNIDAGIDNKASGATCSNVYAAGNKINLKLWYGFTCDGPVVSEDPRAMHIRLSPQADGSSVFRFSHVTFRSKGKQPLIVNDSGYKATVIIDRCVIDVPAGTGKVQDPKKKLVLKLGAGC